MITASELIVLALCMIFLTNNWLIQMLETKRATLQTQSTYTQSTVQSYETQSENNVTVESISTQPITKIDMKKALQQYLDDHLQQHTMQEPTLETQYILPTTDTAMSTNMEKENVKSNEQTKVYGLENWGTDIQPFHSNASNFATI